jgi:predicted amidohydrolase
VKVAAVQTTTRLARVEHNLERAALLVEKAFRQGSEMVVLPEGWIQPRDHLTGPSWR